MPIINYKPTTPSRRNMSVTDYSGLSKVAPEKSLLAPLNKKSGRNSSGRITVRLPSFVPMRMPSHHSTYHSMSAIGVGAGFTSSPTTLPERKRTTLCAIGASAELWVMMSTVMFSSRQMSCSSCRTSLPVS